MRMPETLVSKGADARDYRALLDEQGFMARSANGSLGANPRAQSR